VVKFYMGSMGCGVQDTVLRSSLTHDLLTVINTGYLSFGGARMALIDIEAGFWGLRRQLEALVGLRLTNSILQQAGVNGSASFARAYLKQKSVPGSTEIFRECLAAYQAGGFGEFTIESVEWSQGRVVITGHDAFEAWMFRQHSPHSQASVCAYTAGVFVGFINALTGRTDIVCVEHTCQAQGADVCRFELMPVDTLTAAHAVSYDPDPFLSQQINLLELLFDRMPMGIVILDTDLRLRRVNPTWANFVRQYTQMPVEAVVPGAYLIDLIPQSYDTVEPIMRRVLQGETIHEPALKLVNDGIVSYWNTVLTPLMVDGKVSGVLDVTTDVTCQIQAEQDLKHALDELRSAYALVEQRVTERTRELSTLLNVQQAISSRLNVQSVLQLIADEARHLTNTALSGVYLMEENELCLAVISSEQEVDVPVGYRVALESQPTVEKVLRSGEVRRVMNARQIPPVFRDIVQRTGFSGFIVVPLIADDQLLGVLSVSHKIDGELNADDERILAMMAPGAVIALENARLYEHAEETAATAERNRLARDLHDAVTQTLFSASLTAEVLPRIWQRDPPEGLKRLEKLRELTRGALAEMRTLLLELRPAALVESDLSDLLRQLAEAFTGRTRIPIMFVFDGDCRLPPDVQVALYRIAQEALNNIAKHAQATTASLHLAYAPHKVILTVQDDGIGFDPNDSRASHLGLGIMAERAETIGASLTITSTPGAGTTIAVTWAEEGAS
jgi:signal transduction histidine kinase/PAS domain-containing protein